MLTKSLAKHTVYMTPVLLGKLRSRFRMTEIMKKNERKEKKRDVKIKDVKKKI